MYETWSQILPRRNGVIVHPWPELHQLGWWRFVFFDFFGLFGYMNRYIYRPVYIAYLLYVLSALMGWIGVFKLKNKNSSESVKTESGAERLEKMIWLVFLLCPLLNLAAMVTATLLKITGPHGRYLFPSIIPIDAMLIAGFFRLGDKFGRWATLSLLALHLAVTVGSWLVFYPPR